MQKKKIEKRFPPSLTLNRATIAQKKNRIKRKDDDVESRIANSAAYIFAYNKAAPLKTFFRLFFDDICKQKNYL